jgi:single-strand DNA-binding protein
MNEQNRNEVSLEGVAETTPIFSHESHGVRFDRFFLRVPRLSGQSDLLPVLVPEYLASLAVTGAQLRVTGQLRSFNNKSGAGSRLILSVYALTLEAGDGTPLNRILLDGTLCKPPVLRRTPLGRSICDLMLAVSRRYGRADYLPVIAWGQLAVAAGELRVGSRLALEGRVQSRIYTKVTDTGTEERTAYEVSVMHFCETAPQPELSEQPIFTAET